MILGLFASVGLPVGGCSGDFRAIINTPLYELIVFVSLLDESEMAVRFLSTSSSTFVTDPSVTLACKVGPGLQDLQK